MVAQGLTLVVVMEGTTMAVRRKKATKKKATKKKRPARGVVSDKEADEMAREIAPGALNAAGPPKAGVQVVEVAGKRHDALLCLARAVEENAKAVAECAKGLQSPIRASVQVDSCAA